MLVSPNQVLYQQAIAIIFCSKLFSVQLFVSYFCGTLPHAGTSLLFNNFLPTLSQTLYLSTSVSPDKSFMKDKIMDLLLSLTVSMRR